MQDKLVRKLRSELLSRIAFVEDDELGKKLIFDALKDTGLLKEEASYMLDEIFESYSLKQFPTPDSKIEFVKACCNTICKRKIFEDSFSLTIYQYDL